jgi:hypothetical protein
MYLGTCSEETLGEDILITLIATGFREEAIPDWISLNPPVRKQSGWILKRHFSHPKTNPSSSTGNSYPPRRHQLPFLPMV